MAELSMHISMRLKFRHCHCSMTMALSFSCLRSDEGLTPETPSFEFLYGGQFTLSTQLINPNFLCLTFPPTQHRSLKSVNLSGTFVLKRRYRPMKFNNQPIFNRRLYAGIR